MALSLARPSSRAGVGCAAGASRSRARSSKAARSAPDVSRTPVVAAAAEAVPPNVAEARAWIAAWRAKQPGGAAPAPAPAAKPAASAAPAQPKGKLGASQSFSDGTLVFTADQLKSVGYNDVKLKH